MRGGIARSSRASCPSLCQALIVAHATWTDGPQGVPEAYEALSAEVAAKGSHRQPRRPRAALHRRPLRRADLSLEEVASSAQISPGYLSRLLKLETGFSFVDYLTRVRINKAVQIMNDPAVKVYEVAEAVGYQSQHYFSRAFKRVFGRPPVEYRKGGHEPHADSRPRRSRPRARGVRPPVRRPEGLRLRDRRLQANLTEPWRINMSDEIRTEAAGYPDLRIVFTDAADSNGRQIRDVHTLLDSGIDLLIISPNDSDALSPVIDEAYARIPVILLDRSVEGFDYTLFIGPDNRLVGKQAGQYIAELLGERGGKVVEIRGRSGSPPVLDRERGFREAISHVPSITIVDTIIADWLRDKAEDEVTAWFSRTRAST